MSGELIVQLTDPLRPSLEELAALMRARTEGELAHQGAFNDQTYPTGTQVEELLGVAESIVIAKLGGVQAIPDGLRLAVTKAVLFKAAALVEVSYYAEQANDDNSAYELYEAQYESVVEALAGALKGNRPTEARLGSLPTVGRDGYVPANDAEA